jgi:hypothetical protein
MRALCSSSGAMAGSTVSQSKPWIMVKQTHVHCILPGWRKWVQFQHNPLPYSASCHCPTCINGLVRQNPDVQFMCHSQPKGLLIALNSIQYMVLPVWGPNGSNQPKYLKVLLQSSSLLTDGGREEYKYGYLSW